MTYKRRIHLISTVFTDYVVIHLGSIFLVTQSVPIYLFFLMVYNLMKI